MNLTQKRKGLVSVALIPVIVLSFLILAMQISTNSLKREIIEAFYCTDIYIDDNTYSKYPEGFTDSNFNYIVYHRDLSKPNIHARYNITGQAISRIGSMEVRTDLKLRQVFSWHNFKQGSFWFTYSVIVYDENGDSITGSMNAPVKMIIIKNNGAWEVIEIFEKP